MVAEDGEGRVLEGHVEIERIRGRRIDGVDTGEQSRALELADRRRFEFEACRELTAESDEGLGSAFFDFEFDLVERHGVARHVPRHGVDRELRACFAIGGDHGEGVAFAGDDGDLGERTRERKRLSVGAQRGGKVVRGFGKPGRRPGLLDLEAGHHVLVDDARTLPTDLGDALGGPPAQAGARAREIESRRVEIDIALAAHAAPVDGEAVRADRLDDRRRGVAVGVEKFDFALALGVHESPAPAALRWAAETGMLARAGW